MTNEARESRQESVPDRKEGTEDIGREATPDEAMMAGRAIPEASPGETGFPDGVPGTQPQEPDENHMAKDLPPFPR